MNKTSLKSEPAIQRVLGRSTARSVGSAFANIVFAVATADDKSADLSAQARQCFAKLDGILETMGTDKASILSVSILMADLGQKAQFDELWTAWVGDDTQAWPQRSCVGVTLAPGTLLEITAVAARAA